jgi:SAM-dependent methyltransferase
MPPLSSAMLASCWNAIYREGRYETEPPLGFVEIILDTLRARPAIARGPGLYVGCGNGRNFRPLAEAGLELHGLDTSYVALRHLAGRLGDPAGRLICGDFRDVPFRSPFAYLIAIQVFQHGDQHDVDAYIRRVAAVLRPGGLLFLRVNSTASEIFFRSRLADTNGHGGFSVQCLEGPKSGQSIHFFTKAELLALTADAFHVVAEPTERREVRPPPRSGRWAQWEMIVERTS